ncbi:polysaccharide biosynthesis C-terminal domain-containing protein [Priestia megaterium]|uniref:lipid II flippase MurJ n=1 Tax=Priestia megaterium TaxID=1404 RepID=UPI0021AC7AD1|nr:lipid II flippase MurJ [Priestia megaterium]MCR8929535.1 polysaccharide biosynthesis C-terminal domain-containing protein [Priestia megaterium]
MKFIKSLSILILITIITQLFMMIRTMLMAKHFGVSPEMDAYNLANILTVSTMSIISAAITTILIPELSKNEVSIQSKAAISTFTTLIGIIGIIFTLVFVSLGQEILGIFMGNYNHSIQMLTFQLTLILIFSQLFKIYTSIATAFLQTEENFVAPKISALAAALVSISCFLFISDPSMIEVTFFLGISFAIETIFLFFSKRKENKKTKISFQFNNPIFRMLMRNTIPIIMSSAAFQFSLVFSNFMASRFGKGYISILGYSNQLVTIFHSLIILNIIMMLYPSLAKKFNQSIGEAKTMLVNYITATNMLVIPIVFGFFAIGDLLIELLFQRGNFTSKDTYQVYLMSSLLFVAFPFNTARDYIYRSFYSIQDTRTPARNSLLVVFISILLIIALAPILNIYSIVVGPVLASILSLMLAWYKLKMKIGIIDEKKIIIKNHVFFSLYGFLMYTVLFLIKKNIYKFHMNTLGELILLVLVGVVLFALLTYSTHKSVIKQMFKK